jgi:hypothetical protein
MKPALPPPSALRNQLRRAKARAELAGLGGASAAPLSAIDNRLSGVYLISEGRQETKRRETTNNRRGTAPAPSIYTQYARACFFLGPCFLRSFRRFLKGKYKNNTQYFQQPVSKTFCKQIGGWDLFTISKNDVIAFLFCFNRVLCVFLGTGSSNTPEKESVFVLIIGPKQVRA